MTDQQEQIEQHVAAELQAEQAEEEQQAPARSQAEMLRDAMAGNFVNHCVNGRVAECQEHQTDPRIVGGVDAIASVLAQVINLAGEEGVEQQFGAVMDGLGLITVNGAPVLQLIVSSVIAKAAEQDTAFAMLGELQGVAMKVMMNSAMNQVYSACAQKVAEAAAGAPDPMRPFSVPAAGDDQNEDLPESFKQDVEVARQEAEKGLVQPYKRRTTPPRTQAKPKAHRRRK